MSNHDYDEGYDSDDYKPRRQCQECGYQRYMTDADRARIKLGSAAYRTTKCPRCKSESFVATGV